MSPITKKHQQLILLEPAQAALLDELAAETRIVKQVLLREAVDDLLAKHGKTRTAWYEDIVFLARLAKTIAARYRSRSKEVVWIAKCEELRKRVDELLAALSKT
ncbi:MAG TPA: ribbon-helix-helix domain-containing protein [Steroidobacteraceae bacterium]|jgi:hypothetical protein|nr:ribbon-helix-helix domain-containing protein [Steroidobacteraceae bacterium]